MHDILDFSDFLYLPQITQYNFLIFLVTENFLALTQYNFFIFLVTGNFLALFYHSPHNH